MDDAVASVSERRRCEKIHPFASGGMVQLQVDCVEVQPASSPSVEPVAGDWHAQSQRAGGVDAQLVRPSREWSEDYECHAKDVGDDGEVGDGFPPALLVNFLSWAVVVVGGEPQGYPSTVLVDRAVEHGIVMLDDRSGSELALQRTECCHVFGNDEQSRCVHVETVCGVGRVGQVQFAFHPFYGGHGCELAWH